jgi:hypothetical protein
MVTPLQKSAVMIRPRPAAASSSPRRLLAAFFSVGLAVGVPALGSVACGAADTGAQPGAADAANERTDTSLPTGSAPDAAIVDAGSSGNDGASSTPPPPFDSGPVGDASCPFGGGAANRLSVSGTKILGPSGQPIALRGWNWGQWGSVQPQDGADNRAQGANVVRIPLRWWGQYDNDQPNTPIAEKTDSYIDTPPYVDQGHLDTLDAMIQEAACQGLWIDLFVDSDCGQESAESTSAYCGSTDGGVESFATDPVMRARFTAVWQLLVTKYLNQPYIGMYEILPEPSFDCTSKKNCVRWQDAPDFYTPIAQSLRAIDARTPLLVGANGGYSETMVATALIPGIPGLIYTVDLLNDNAQDPAALSVVTSFRDSQQVPIFVQQVGVEQATADAGAVATTILADLDSDDIGWTWWTYRVLKSDQPTGYAPFYQGTDAGTWAENTAWLDLITAHFAP